MPSTHPDTWTPRRLPKKSRPTALPEKWGAHWIAEDFASRSGCGTFLEREPLYALGVHASQFVMYYHLPWSQLPVGVFIGFLYAEVINDTPRVLEIIRGFDLLADYLACCGEIDEATRRRLVEEAGAAIANLERTVH